MVEDCGSIQLFIHEFLALEGKIEQFAKAFPSTRRTCKAPPDPVARKAHAFSFKAVYKNIFVLCLSPCTM
jgi:hypothetical protein